MLWLSNVIAAIKHNLIERAEKNSNLLNIIKIAKSLAVKINEFFHASVLDGFTDEKLIYFTLLFL